MDRGTPRQGAYHLKDQLSLNELESKIIGRLRDQPFYSRLKRVRVEPSKFVASGWIAEVSGDFSIAEHAEAARIVTSLGNSYALFRDSK